jgi:hypothetical protein
MPDDDDKDDGRPSFAEVVKAFTPPGTDFEEFKAALLAQGAPGMISPEMVAILSQGGIMPEVIAQTGVTCARCDHQHGGPPGPACLDAERHLGRSPLRRSPDLQLDAISGRSDVRQCPRCRTLHGPAVACPAPLDDPMPPDPRPMTPGAMAATAMHEAYLDLMAGGFTRDEALTILARAFAARNGSADG